MPSRRRRYCRVRRRRMMRSVAPSVASLLFLGVSGSICSICSSSNSSSSNSSSSNSSNSSSSSSSRSPAMGAGSEVDPLAFVDTRIGTGGLGWGVGGQNPGAQVPFGACRAGPDTSSLANLNVQELGVHYGGYWFEDTHVRAFSHTHMVGAGAGDWGNVGVMPVLGAVSAKQVAEPNSGGWASKFSHDSETAVPGYYAVDLEVPWGEDGGHELLPAERLVRAEVTATTTHAAFHRYTFPPTSSASASGSGAALQRHPSSYSVLVDACHTASADVEPMEGSGMFWEERSSVASPDSRQQSDGSLGTNLGANKQCCKAATITVDEGAQAFTGWVDNAGALSERSVNGSVRVFFYAEASARCGSGSAGGATLVPASGSGAWADFVVQPPGPNSTTTAASTNRSGSAGAFLSFPAASGSCGAMATSEGITDSATSQLAVEMAIGISFISTDGAKQNLEQAKKQLLSNGALGIDSTAHSDSASDEPAFFDAAREVAQELWRNQLSVVAVNADGADPVKLTKFYSSLYRASMSPTTYTEQLETSTAQQSQDIKSSGTVGVPTKQYLGFDGLVHQWPYADASSSGTSDYYSDMSIWDIHRTQLPLLILSDPSRARDIARSLVKIADDGGHIPRWPLANVYSGCMIADHGFSFIADACVKGIEGVNFSHALTYMRATGLGGGNGGQRKAYGNYSTLGYVTEAEDETAAPYTLSYAFDDASIFHLAQCLLDQGEPDPTGVLANTTKLFSARAKNYQTQWNADRRLMCPRDVEGNYLCPPAKEVAVPYPLQQKYLEGDAAQWLWFVPGDPDGLRTLFPSNQTYLSDLEELFNKSTTWALPNTIPNPWYWAGNEPDLLAPWQFAFAAGGATRTQYWTRWLMDHKYTEKAGGVPGNDDFGTMSAWFVFAGLGLYPLPGTTRYIVGSPIFPSAELRPFTTEYGPINVTSHGASSTAVYVERMEVNGVAVDLKNHPFVDHTSLVRKEGASLEFWMTPEEPAYAATLTRERVLRQRLRA